MRVVPATARGIVGAMRGVALVRVVTELGNLRIAIRQRKERSRRDTRSSRYCCLSTADG